MNKDHFAYRHTGPRPEEIPAMLGKIGVQTLDELIDKTIPAAIRTEKKLKLKRRAQLLLVAYLEHLSKSARTSKAST